MHVNVCETAEFWRDFFRANGVIRKKLKTSNVVSSFIVCSPNRNRSAIVRDLVGYNSFSVRQLYENISLALFARDLLLLYN